MFYSDILPHIYIGLTLASKCLLKAYALLRLRLEDETPLKLV